MLKSFFLAVLMVVSSDLFTVTARAQTVQWSGIWLGLWSGSGTSSCGDYTDSGVMALTWANVSNLVAGAGAMGGIYCCQDLGYHESAGPFTSTISGKTIKIIASDWPLVSPCGGGSLSFGITATNYGTTIAGTITQSQSGSDFAGSLALDLVPAGNMTNKIVMPHRLPNGDVQMVFFGVNSNSYAFQNSTDLVKWVSISDFVVTNIPLVVADKTATNLAECFYRMVPLTSGTN